MRERNPFDRSIVRVCKLRVRFGEKGSNPDNPKAGNFCKAGRSLRKHNHKVESHKLNFTENA